MAVESITINIGGEKIIQVRPELFSVVGDNKFATLCSERWQNHLDANGHLFVDCSPQVFLPLIEFLRLVRDSEPGISVPVNVDPAHRRAWIRMMLSSSFHPKVLHTAGLTSQELRSCGCDTRFLCEAGFSGYSLQELLDSGYTSQQLRQAGFTVADFQDSGLAGLQLRDAGFTSGDLLQGGLAPQQILASGFGLDELRQAGTTPQELLNDGVTLEELVEDAQFTLEELCRGGLTLRQMFEAGFTARELRDFGFTPQELLDGRFTFSRRCEMLASQCNNWCKAG